VQISYRHFDPFLHDFNLACIRNPLLVGVKQRIAVMLGFKAFTNAAITIATVSGRDNSDWDV
jgi:hypothetical protein